MVSRSSGQLAADQLSIFPLFSAKFPTSLFVDILHPRAASGRRPWMQVFNQARYIDVCST